MKKRICSIFLVLAMMFCLTSIANAESIEVDEPELPARSIASCAFYNFYSYSGTASVTLSQYCNSVSVMVKCSSGIDYCTLVISDISHNGTYSSSLPFTANGTTTTFYRGFAAGSYVVSIYGSNKLHTIGLVAFSA